MTDRSVLLNAFLPATELDDPERFAGRSKQVRELADSLNAFGSTPLIFGDRGLGKSSLAVQVQIIAKGDTELLTELNASRLIIPPERQYLTFYVTCTAATEGFQDLLQLMINAAEAIELEGKSKKASRLVDRTTRKQITLKIFEWENTRHYEAEVARISHERLNLEEKLKRLCDVLTITFSQPVLFVIDELDRLDDTEGLASFLKAASNEDLKFMLVGISTNVADLLSDHQSLERRLQPIKVPLMTRQELAQIVLKAQAYLNLEGIPIQFSQGAVARLSQVASGFPWFVHVLGQQCLVDADAESRVLVDRVHVDACIEGIVHNRFAQQFSDMYQVAVRDSEPREKTLRAFAHWDSEDIPTGEMYRILERGELQVRGGSTYRGHLCAKEYGEILFVPPLQKRGLVRFKNEMFKAYVRMRPSIYEGVDSAVSAAYRNR